MGAENSSELAHPFAELAKWPKNRVDSVIKAYHEGEYDFGVDYNVVMSITGYDIEEAKELLAAHSKNDSGIVNAVTLLISIITLGNNENRNEIVRAENIYDLVDFNKAAKITYDEFTILLLCIVSSYSFILEGNMPEEIVLSREAKIMQFAKFVYETLKKRSNAMLTKEEFIRFFKDYFWSQGMNALPDIFRRLISDPLLDGPSGPGDGDDNGEKKGDEGKDDSRSNSPTRGLEGKTPPKK
eukprot:gene7243-7817_t